MLLSLNTLKNCIENYKKYKSKSGSIENYDNEKSVKKGFTDAINSFLVIIALIFFLFELLLLYFAIYIAIKCSKSREERIVNFVLAIIFTIPYVLLNILFNPCAKIYLQNGMKN